jgi:hypothetical protein
MLTYMPTCMELLHCDVQGKEETQRSMVGSHAAAYLVVYRNQQSGSRSGSAAAAVLSCGHAAPRTLVMGSLVW